MPGLGYRAALRIYRVLPTTFRRHLVRWLSPSFTVGAMCFIERNDGALLLVRHSYRKRWGIPGGLLKKGEDARDGVRREVMEEVGITVEIVGEPTVVVDADPQRVDVIFRGRVAPGSPPAALKPSSPEIIDVQWFRPDELPELQFETASALVALARASTNRPRRPLPDPVWPDLG